eukprot:4119106-Prymnesium_polylepis.2
MAPAVVETLEEEHVKVVGAASHHNVALVDAPQLEHSASSALGGLNCSIVAPPNPPTLSRCATDHEGGALGLGFAVWRGAAAANRGPPADRRSPV